MNMSWRNNVDVHNALYNTEMKFGTDIGSK